MKPSRIINTRCGPEVPCATGLTDCPLCNTSITYDRRLDGRVHDFGTTGRLYKSALVMYDRQTESRPPR